HYFYRCVPGAKTQKFTDPTDRKTTLVEFRCQKTNGAVGLQTVVPPSVHQSGEQIQFEPGFDGDPAQVESSTLLSAVRRIAAAAALSRYWPAEGARHDAFLALAGVLSRAGWSFEETFAFHRAIYRAAWLDEADFEACRKEVETTFAKQATAGETTGFKTLSELV